MLTPIHCCIDGLKWFSHTEGDIHPPLIILIPPSRSTVKSVVSWGFWDPSCPVNASWKQRFYFLQPNVLSLRSKIWWAVIVIRSRFKDLGKDVSVEPVQTEGIMGNRYRYHPYRNRARLHWSFLEYSGFGNGKYKSDRKWPMLRYYYIFECVIAEIKLYYLYFVSCCFLVHGLTLRFTPSL